MGAMPRLLAWDGSVTSLLSRSKKPLRPNWLLHAKWTPVSLARPKKELIATHGAAGSIFRSLEVANPAKRGC